MMLSKYFTLDELIVSEYAARKGIDNSPGMEVMTTLTHTAFEMDKVRELLGHPVIVSSGFRCHELNTAINGAPNSGHTKGEAVDFICPGYGSVREVFDAIRKSNIQYDQCISEYGRWIHISFGYKQRKQALAYNGNGYREVV